MPFTYAIDRERGLIVVTASGTITGTDYIQVLQRVVADPLFDPSYVGLIDARDIREVILTPEELDILTRTMADLTEAYGAACPVAVVNRRKMDRTVTMLLRAKRKGGNMESFDTMEEALAWLGRQHPSFLRTDE